MTDKQIEALKFARKVLNDCHYYSNDAFAAYAALEAALAEESSGTKQPAQQQEPVAWPHKWGCRANAFGECNMGCTSPQPTQPWVGLTDEDIRPLCNQAWVFDTVKQWSQIIEATLREKNT